MKETPIKILLVDDHQIILDGIEAILDSSDLPVKIVAKASNGEKLKDHLGDNIDIVVMDVNMPGADGISTAEYIKENYAGIKVIMLTSYEEPRIIRSCLKVGVDAYLIKSRGVDDLVSAITSVMKGQKYFSPEISNKIVAMASGTLESKDNTSVDKMMVESMTEREVEILKLIAMEYSSKEIGKELFLSAETINSYRKNLLRKTNSKNVAGLVKFAIEHKIV